MYTILRYQCTGVYVAFICNTVVYGSRNIGQINSEYLISYQNCHANKGGNDVRN